MLTSKYYPDALAEIYQYIENKDDQVEEAKIVFSRHYNTNDVSEFSNCSFEYFARHWNLVMSHELVSNGNQLVNIKFTVDYIPKQYLILYIDLYFSNEDDPTEETYGKQRELSLLVDEVRQVYFYRSGGDNDGN